MLQQGFRKTLKVLSCAVISLIFLVLWTVAPLSSLPKVSAASNPTYRYTKTFDLGPGGSAFGASTAADSNGNVYINGYFIGTVTFDGLGGSDTLTAQNNEAFVTKYDKDGTYQWTKIMDSNASGSGSFAHNLVVDSNDNLFVAGHYNGTVVFDGTGGGDSLSSGGGNDSSFLTKINADSTYGWTKTFDVTNGNTAESGLAIDEANGYIYETGQYSGTIAFDGPGGTDTHGAGFNTAVYLAKYSLDGTYISTQTLNATNGASNMQSNFGGNNVAVDSSGGVYVGGAFTGTINVAGTSQNFTTPNPDAFMVTFDAGGSFVWGKTFDVSSGSASAQNFSLATFGTHIYMAGRFTDTVVFDGTGGTHSVTSANATSYVTAYSAGGAYEWTRTVDASGGVYSAQAQVITADILGNVYIGGTFYGELLFDGPGGSDTHGTGVTTATNYLTKLDPNGGYEWTRIIYPDGGTNGSVQDVPYMGIACDTLGSVFLSGNFYGQITFDGPGGTDTQNANPDGAFLTSYVAFIPPPASPVGSVAPLPGAPNTGFEKSMNGYQYIVVGFGIIAAELLLVGSNNKSGEKKLLG
jgi:hypothetical protein